MSKFERKFIFIDVVDSGLRLQGQTVDPNASFRQKLARLLALPAMVAGGIVGAIFFSAFLAMLLIPLAIWGAWTWWRLRNRKSSQQQDIIDGEYTVLDRQKPDNKI